jgi:Flp pilus assembly CpaE family ATPase
MGYDRSRIRLLLNRAHTNVGIDLEDVVRILGETPSILVPSDREIPRAVNEGVAIVDAKPESAAAGAFRALAALYTLQPDSSVNGAPPPRVLETTGQSLGTFRKLIGRRA